VGLDDLQKVWSDTFLLTCGGGQYECWWCSWGGGSCRCLVIFKYWLLHCSM